MLKQISFVCLIFTFAIGILSVEAQEQTKIQPIGEEAYQVLLWFFEYDKDIPLDARVVEKAELENCVREKIVFTGKRNNRVPGYIAFPKKGKPPYPCVLLLHGSTASKSVWWKDDFHDDLGYEWKYIQIASSLLSEGYAVLALDAPYHGERTASNDYEPPDNLRGTDYWWNDTMVESTIEYRRLLDYLATRTDIDSTRIGMIGQSMGGMMTFMLTAIEPRVQVSVATVAPPSFSTYWGPSNAYNFATHITCPFLMINGRKDESYTIDSSEQLYDLIKSPTKNIIWYNSGHNLPIEHVEDAVNWFKEHL
ncbi:alpha/beta hydrolase family protein [Candidatus Latescibacterota bacterium]